LLRKEQKCIVLLFWFYMCYGRNGLPIISPPYEVVNLVRKSNWILQWWIMQTSRKSKENLDIKGAKYFNKSSFAGHAISEERWLRDKQKLFRDQLNSLVFYLDPRLSPLYLPRQGREANKGGRAWIESKSTLELLFHNRATLKNLVTTPLLSRSCDDNLYFSISTCYQV